MAKTTTRIPSYRLNKSSGRAVVTLDGKDRWLGKHGTEESRDRYNRLIGEWLANGRRMPVKAYPDLTVTELVAAYWQRVQLV